MIKLYEREECPACAQVRRVLAQNDLTYESHYVPRLGSERTELQQLSGLTSVEVPVLVDGDTTIQGSEQIMAHIQKTYSNGFGDPSYGLTKVMEGVNFGDAVPKVKEALASEGFGVLSEIDVKATLKKKLDADMQNYLILGACNPPLAHQALTAEPALGLLLPCNVVVSEDKTGNAVVSAIAPKKMFEVVGNPGMEGIASEVQEKLKRALSSL